MIGYDDIFDCYLATEVDENVNSNININNSVKEVPNFAMEEIKEEEEIVNEEELIEELPTDSETEPEEIEAKREQYENISGIENFEGITPFEHVDAIDNPTRAYEIEEIEVVIPTESDNIEIELTGPEQMNVLKDNEESFETAVEEELCETTPQQQVHSSSDKFYDVLNDHYYEDLPCSLQLTEPNYSQLILESTAPRISDEVCRICAKSNCNEVDSDNWLICFGCGEAFHRICLKEKLRRIKCEMPIIYRNRLDGPDDVLSKKFTHAPWFCNTCVKCSNCEGRKTNDDDTSKNINLKESFASCRHCGKLTCLACYNSESFYSNNSVQLSRFSDLKNYSCPGCLQCINCGLSARPPAIENRRKSISFVKQAVVLYDDLTLCRPCYLSNQNCCTCPRCNQIYHSLPDHYDFGEAPYDPDFSLCPMVSCDDCGSWTHCQCEGIDDEEYERLGTDKNAKFTCVNCKKPNKKKSKQTKKEELISKKVFRLGNLMRTDDETIVFNFWHFDEPWKRQTYELTFKRRKFVLSEFNGTDKIEADSLVKLASKFTQKFRNCDDFEGLNCLKAINPQLVFNLMRLLTFLEPSGGFEQFCEHLRDEISTVEEFVCARTRPYKAVKDAFVKQTVNENRRLSLSNFPEAKPSPQNPTSAAVNTGKMTVKFLYSQYIHMLKSDPDKSINTTDVHSCGLALRPSAISGFGLFATRTFQRNSLIIEYCGEMLTGEAMVNKRDALYNALGKRYQQSCYLFRLDELKVLDATHKGNLSRFINHSCDPNCYSRVVQIDSSKKLLIFASKVIEAGEEIVYDYKFPDEEQKIPCLCGSEKCRKWMN